MKRLDVSTPHDTDTAGVEPLLYRAGNITKSRTIGVFATPSTLKSRSYIKLKQHRVASLTVIEPDCHNWSDLINKNLSEHIDLEVSVGEMMRWQTDVILIVSSSYSELRGRIARLAGPSVRILNAADYI